MFIKIIENHNEIFSIKFYFNDELYVLYLPYEKKAEFRSSLKPIINNDNITEINELIKDKYLELDEDSEMFIYLTPFITKASLKKKGYKPCWREGHGCMEMIQIGLYCKSCSTYLNEQLKINRKLNQKIKK